MTFEEISKSVVKSFIQTVIFVDDRASFGVDTSDHEKIDVIEPDIIVKDSDSKFQTDIVVEDFNAKKIIDAFSNYGILTSILKPEIRDESSIVKTVSELAKIVDVLILDIDINKDDGEASFQIFEQICNDDPKLKLLVFYSGAGKSKIVEFSKKIEDSINRKGKKIEDFIYQINKTRITVFSKEGVKLRDVSYDDLPDKVIQEFTNISKGIISNTTMYSLAILRQNIHRLLNNLGPEMDAPFLSHRSWLENPDDSSDFIIDLILSEIQTFLKNNDIKKFSDVENILAYLEFHKPNGQFEINLPNGKTRNIDRSNLTKVITNGLDKKEFRDEINKGSKEKYIIGKEAFKFFTNSFCFNGEDFKVLDNKFTILTSMENSYDSIKIMPKLTLGTIIKNSFDEYFICIQPKCDSVRIKENTPFLFWQLSKNENDFNFIIKENDSFIKLKPTKKVFNLKIISFLGNADGYVKAILEGGFPHFRDIDQKRYLWLAQLKENFAQRLLNNYSYDLSRVGLDEYEWLRRSAKSN